MTKNTFFAATLVATFALLCTPAQAVVIGSFEGTDDGFGLVNSTSITPDTTWSTEGNYSLKLEGHGSDWSQPIRKEGVQALLAGNDTVSFDYFVPGFTSWMNLGFRIVDSTGININFSETVTSDTGTISWNYVDAGYDIAGGQIWSTLILDGI